MNHEPSNIFYPYEGFIHYLQNNNFNVGMDTYLRVQELVNHFEPNIPIQRLRHILCPIFAQSPEEQEKFYYLFDAYFSKFELLNEAEFSETNEANKEKNIPETPNIGNKRWWFPKRPIAFAGAILFTILVAIGANVAWKLFTNYREAERYYSNFHIEQVGKRKKLTYAINELLGKEQPCDS
ncbi:MAG: hypothetical protein ACKVTZ_05595, partial [Bacteroidia bacterium]